MAFSLLPARNATGNYVKIVQRVPVKIVIDHPPSDSARSGHVRVADGTDRPRHPRLPAAEALAVSATGSRALGSADIHGAAANPWLIAVLVAFAAFMEGSTHHRQRCAAVYRWRAGVSEDEASWVVTTYLVANAVSLTGSSYFAQRLGRKPSSSSA